MNILVTGCAGFIGSAFVRMYLGKAEKPDVYQKLDPQSKIIGLDILSYAASLDNLKPIEKDPRFKFYKGDICDGKLAAALVKEHKIDSIINFAAESHVDRSIQSSEAFARTNVLGTVQLLDVARAHSLRFVQVSTDEVYGTLGETGSFTEETPLKPNSPYSASKTAADCFVRSYFETHKLDAVITRCSNNYGPYQYPEKFLPVAILGLINNKKIPVYGTGKNTRDWLHVEDHCEGVYLALKKGRAGEVYNFGGFGEHTNLEMAEKLAKKFGKNPSDCIQFVEDRKGHDWRYSMNPSKAQKTLGWTPKWELEEGLSHMVDWYKNNSSWWKSKISG